MKKLILLFLIVFLIGCEERIEGMVYLDEDFTIDYSSYETTLASIPGNLTLISFRPENNRLLVNYKYRDGYHISDSAYWDEHYKEILLYNGGILLSDQSLDEVMVFAESAEYTYMATVKREDFLKAIGSPDDLEIKDLVLDHMKDYYDLHSVLKMEKEEPC